MNNTYTKPKQCHCQKDCEEPCTEKWEHTKDCPRPQSQSWEDSIIIDDYVIPNWSNYSHRGDISLQEIRQKHGVTLHQFVKDVLATQRSEIARRLKEAGRIKSISGNTYIKFTDLADALKIVEEA